MLLPSALLAILWYLICVAMPLLQTLHALQQSSKEEEGGERKKRQLWLFYWIGLAACLQLSFLADWSVRLPFYLLAMIFTDIYYEVQLVCVTYLLWPGSNRLQQLLDFVGSICARALEKVMMYGLQKVLKAMQEMRQSQQGGANPSAGCAQQIAEASDRGKDMPGSYVIMAEAGVTSEIKPSPDTVIGRLKKGDVVTVLEVVEDEGGDKVRGLLEKPHGWISIVNRGTGKRWAARCEEGAPLPGGNQLQEGLMAAASVAGCNTLPLLLGSSAGAAPVNVTPEEAWEAMALLESQLARADDRSEDANVQNASALLRQMLKVLATQGESDSNQSMLTMTQTMVPEIGKIWAHPDTREYFKGLLTLDSSTAATALPAATAGGASSSSSGGAVGVGGGDGLGSDPWVLIGGPNEAETTVEAGGAADSTESPGAGGSGLATSVAPVSAEAATATAADGAAVASSSSGSGDAAGSAASSAAAAGSS